MKARSSLFLIEITLMALVFALCAAICLEIFAYSSNLSEQSAALSRGAIIVQSAAESFKATGSVPETADMLSARPVEGGYIVPYGRGLLPAGDGDETVYTLKLTPWEGDLKIELVKVGEGTPVLSLLVKAVAHD